MITTLTIERISFSYRTAPLIQDFSLAVAQPGLILLAGANGSGKTTLLRLLTGTLRPQSGALSWRRDGQRLDPAINRSWMAWLPAELEPPPFLTGAELIAPFAAMRGVDPSTALPLLHSFVLDGHLGVAFKSLSLGMQRKMLLCASLIGAPQAVVLDEPANGLDADAQQILATTLATLARTAIVIITAHSRDFLANVPHTVIEAPYRGQR